jgi:hypothetical protein
VPPTHVWTHLDLAVLSLAVLLDARLELLDAEVMHLRPQMLHPRGRTLSTPHSTRPQRHSGQAGFRAAVTHLLHVLLLGDGVVSEQQRLVRLLERRAACAHLGAAGETTTTRADQCLPGFHRVASCTAWRCVHAHRQGIAVCWGWAVLQQRKPAERRRSHLSTVRPFLLPALRTLAGFLSVLRCCTSSSAV